MTDWPLPLLLDEAWLRSRRAAVRALERSGLWPVGDEHWTVMAHQAQAGQSLKCRVLAHALDPQDYAALNGSTLFGPQNERVRRRLPAVLAFGDAVGRFLARAGAVSSEDTPLVGDSGTLFNLGISLVDVVVDHMPAEAVDLLRILGDSSLGALAEPSSRAEHAAQFVYCTAESRVILGVVIAFFGHVDALNPTPADRSRLVELLDQALAAETASTRQDLSSELRKQMAIDKSVLPFVILGALASFRAADCPAVEALAADLGEAFSIIDDLTDLVSDLQTRAVNGILLTNPHYDAAADAALLESFLDNSVPDLRAAAAVEALGRVQHWVIQRNERKLDAELQRILHFMRNWLE